VADLDPCGIGADISLWEVRFDSDTVVDLRERVQGGQRRRKDVLKGEAEVERGRDHIVHFVYEPYLVDNLHTIPYVDFVFLHADIWVALV
jgi:hypothetical protein